MWLLVVAAVGLWIGGWAHRKRHRRRSQTEVTTTLETGMPSGETALGQKAKEVAAAEAQKMATPPPVHGSARWATREDARRLIDPFHWDKAPDGSRSLSLGMLMEEGEGPPERPGDDTVLPVVVRYPGHVLTVAGTGQGKSATQIIANLLTYKGSVVVLDPKGELYTATAAKRRTFGRVFRLAPLARPGEPPSDHFNPLDELDDRRELANRARLLAEMLIVRQGGKGAADATFFENEAINLLTAIIMFVVELSESPKFRPQRTLSEVRHVCTLPLLAGRETRNPNIREYLEDVFVEMATRSTIPYVRRQGSVFQGYEPKLLGSFVSEINSNLAFWDGHPGFAEVTATSDFRLKDLESVPTTIYLTIPLKDMPANYRYLRVMIGLTFAALEEKQDARHASVLFILDEFPALRDMEFMRDAVAQMRSSGAWFWIFVQDVAQLDAVYGRWSDVFLSQTDHQIFFGATVDARTLKHISSALGVRTFPYRDPSVSWSHSVGISDGSSEQITQPGGVNMGRSVNQSINIAEPVKLAARPLLTPDEVGTFLGHCGEGETHSSTGIVFSKQAGGYPLQLRRQHWKKIPGILKVSTARQARQATGGGEAP